MHVDQLHAPRLGQIGEARSGHRQGTSRPDVRLDGRRSEQPVDLLRGKCVVTAAEVAIFKGGRGPPQVVDTAEGDLRPPQAGGQRPNRTR